MPERMLFGEVLEVVDQMPPDEQETLVEIVSRRIAERGRRRLIDDIEEARSEYREGKCQSVSVEELMDEIQS